jgi:hypothetical protein
MKPHEYALDPIWKDLANQRASAEQRLDEAEAVVAASGYGDGRMEALLTAEQTLAAIEQAIQDREATISKDYWASW